MSLSHTYTTLTTAIKNTIDGDTGSTGGLRATANIDNIIQAAEERILTDLPLVIFDGEDTIALTINTVTVSKPTGFVSWRSANYTDASSRFQPLELRTLEYMQDYWPNPATTGLPKFMADYSATQWKVAPTPSATFSGKALFVKRPVSIVTDTSGTWISQKVGLLLEKACFVEAEKFIKSDERSGMWDADYMKALVAAHQEFRHLFRPGFAPLAAMPEPKEEK